MKKTVLLLTIFVFVLAFGSAFAEDSSAKNKEVSAGITPYNGITFFDLGPTPACEDAGKTAGDANEAVHVFNGITFFDLGRPGAGGRIACADKSNVKVSSSRPYNGITIF